MNVDQAIEWADYTTIRSDTDALAMNILAAEVRRLREVNRELHRQYVEEKEVVCQLQERLAAAEAKCERLRDAHLASEEQLRSWQDRCGVAEAECAMFQREALEQNSNAEYWRKKAEAAERVVEAVRYQNNSINISDDCDCLLCATLSAYDKEVK